MKHAPTPDWLTKFVRTFDSSAPTAVGMSEKSRIEHQQARAQAVKDLDLLEVFVEETGAKKNRASREGIKNSTKTHVLAGKKYELPSHISSITNKQFKEYQAILQEKMARRSWQHSHRLGLPFYFFEIQNWLFFEKSLFFDDPDRLSHSLYI